MNLIEIVTDLKPQRDHRLYSAERVINSVTTLVVSTRSRLAALEPRSVCRFGLIAEQVFSYQYSIKMRKKAG